MPEDKILSGKDAARSIYDSLKPKIFSLNKRGVNPGLCVILVGDDTASRIYVRTKTKKLKSMGLVSDAILLSEDIDKYYDREVKPHIPDSWMDREKDKVGYEINFTKYFYKFSPLRSLEDISQDLKSLNDEIERLSREMTGE